MFGTVFLIPNTLGDAPLGSVFPEFNFAIIRSISHFIVEDVRTARRFLKKVDKDIDIDSLTFAELNKHTSPQEISTLLAPAIEGRDMGVISEAGCPCIADPGADIVRMAQKKGIRCVPLVGPSSILMSLMASGFNGQSFAFVGYLPIDPSERAARIRALEKRAQTERQSQIFIETPYRNMKMMEALLSALRPQTMLCVAADITLSSEYIITKTVAEWKSQKTLPDLSKRPTVFIIY